MSTTIPALKSPETNGAYDRLNKRIAELEMMVMDYRRIIELAGDIIYTLNLHGDFTYVNKTGLRLTGYTKEEIVGRNYITLVHPSHQVRMKEYYRRQKREGIVQTYNELPLVKKDGTLLWLGQNIILVREGDRVIGFQGISRDITRERLWKEHVRTLTDAIHQSADMMIITDLDGRIEFVNEAFVKTTGYTPEEAIGQNPRLLRSGLHSGEFYRDIWTTISRGDVWYGIMKNRKKDGTVYDDEMTITPIRDEKGSLIRYVAIKRDVTGRLYQEQHQRENVALLQALLHAVEQGIELDQDRRITWTNEAMCRIFGYTRDELLGQSTRLFYESDQLYREIGEEAPRIIRERGVYRRIINARRKSGELFPCEVFGTLINENDPAKGMVGVFNDLSEQQRAEQSLAEKVAFQQAVLRSVEQGVEFDQDRRFKWVNEAMCRMFGYTRGELLEQSTRMIYESRDVYDRVGVELHRQIAEKGYYNEVVHGRRKNGDIFECEIYGTPLDRNDIARGLVGVFTDVTEQKRQEEARERMTTLLRGIIDGSTQYSIIATDVNGTITLFNKGAEIMFGFEAGEMVGIQSPLVLRDPEETAKLARRIHDETGDLPHGFDVLVYEAQRRPHYEIETTDLRKDGSRFPARVTITPMRDKAGSITGYLSITKDITDERKAQEQIGQMIEELQHSQKSLRELNAQKDKFLSIVSHDLRSPFNSILGFSELLLDPAQDLTSPESREFLRVIQQSAELQLRLINNLLDWSRLETNRMPFKPKALTLSRLLDSCLGALRGISHKKHITLAHAIPSHVEVEADENLVQQLFQNLVGNALKFTPDGGCVNITVDETKPDVVRISIRDTGVGIPSVSLAQLFRIDTMYHTQGTDGERGSGLGLLLCKEIVEKHQGEIWVESEMGKGTTVSFTLPRISKSKILIVDDSSGDRLLYRKFLEQLFPDVITVEATNGYEGLTLALEQRPAMIILDFSMPVMDGLRFLQELRRNHEIEETPVVVITGVDSNASRDTLLHSGARAVIDKPVTKNIFEEIVQTYLIPRK